MKTPFTLFAFFLFISTFAIAQNKYKRIYGLKNNFFPHTASFSSGDAVIYINRDSLIGNYQHLYKYSEYQESIKEKIKSAADTLLLLSRKSDTTNISIVNLDQGVLNITLAYFLECALNKKANILDKRTNKLVKKIIVKKSPHSSKSSHTYACHYFYLPNDKKEFMSKQERIGSGIKFL